MTDLNQAQVAHLVLFLRERIRDLEQKERTAIAADPYIVADCVAKRSLVLLLVRFVEVTAFKQSAVMGLRIMATPWREHRDYVPEWEPTA